MERKKKYDEKFVRKTLRFTPDEFAKNESKEETKTKTKKFGKSR